MRFAAYMVAATLFLVALVAGLTFAVAYMLVDVYHRLL